MADVDPQEPDLSAPDSFVTRLPWLPTYRPDSRLNIRLRARHDVRLHPSLPPTSAWTYDGHLPGPTIEVDAGEPLEVRWRNDIPPTETLPVKAVVAPYDGGKVIPQNLPGAGDAPSVPGTDDLAAYSVVHLHGGKTEADSDGWTDNVHAYRSTQVTRYRNDQRARMMWYHDHAMGITRLNVVAGLAGLYVVRDAEEAALRLPRGRYELPLLIADRNLDTDAAGNFTGAMLHKTESGQGPMEYFAPYTLVNGAIWPYADVEPRTYRLRWLNGSNARTYRLVFARRDETGAWAPIASDAGFVTQIGTDCGLLGAPVNLPREGLILASAERADLLVNFGNYPGETIRVFNIAEAPFGNAEVPAGSPSDAAPENRRPFPDVMEFRVADFPAKPAYVAPPVLSSFTWRDHDQVEHTAHRLVALVEDAGTLQLHEMAQVTAMISKNDPDSGGADVIVKWYNLTTTDPVREAHLTAEVERHAAMGHKLLVIVDTVKDTTPGAPPDRTIDTATVYHSAASMFHDAPTFFAEAESTEVWRIVNLSPDTHPVHVHLGDAQPLQRRFYASTLTFDPPRDPGADPAAAQLLWPAVQMAGSQPDPRAAVDLRPAVVTAEPEYAGRAARFDDQTWLLDANEKGLKDTIRVNPGEVVSFAITFTGHSGRYIYHCHILEHEDHEMMRPFIVAPAQMLTAMGHGGHHH